MLFASTVTCTWASTLTSDRSPDPRPRARCRNHRVLCSEDTLWLLALVWSAVFRKPETGKGGRRGRGRVCAPTKLIFKGNTVSWAGTILKLFQQS